ncbi:Rhs element Vgr protein [Mucilaginibacter mallensis]|uniref:Rhs element Vgr protein n=1 Tax=Mucilaginibacter mallensis TaxID=652787 RepID=A0A1H1XVD5_MUCMA|nr:type VI secretion system tip protein VgrG [Mucilaginibacter mallensis]SDT12819.1 Rhs element Vgr protein [Mucilaginibacter mallensis]
MSVVTITIKSNGTVMSADYQLLAVDIAREVNRVPYAELLLIDGDYAKQEFKISDGDFFDLGKEVEVSLGYSTGSENGRTAFKGIVMKQALRQTAEGCVLSVELSDKVIRMTSTRNSNVFSDLTDGELISKLIESDGLNALVDATETVHTQIVQYQATNWDMMLTRAEANGLLVITDNGAISVTKPDFTKAAVMEFEVGISLLDFEIELDAGSQYTGFKSSIWNPDELNLTTMSPSVNFSIDQGNLKPRAAAAAIGFKENSLLSAVPMPETEASAWAESQTLKSHMAMLKGSFTTSGTLDICVGNMFSLKGVGKKFTGKNMVSGIRHQVTTDGWLTTCQFGTSAESFSSAMQTADAKAAGLLPGIGGLQTGIVEALETDAQYGFMVKVAVAGIDSKDKSVHARMATLDGGEQHGIVFWPETGDEVVLGFLNEDPRFPIILGSLFGKKQQPPLVPAEKNPEKGVVTRQGLKMIFNDEKKTVSISTSDQRSILIDEENHLIEISDTNDNKISLSDEGILLKSNKDIMLKADGDVRIDGKNINIKGSKIDLT